MNPISNRPYSETFYKILGKTKELPASQPAIFNEFREKFEASDVLILTAATGAGKSARIPLHVVRILGLDAQIAVSQPRVLTTNSTAGFLAAQLDVELGGFVGYRTRFDKKISDATHLSVMVDAILAVDLLGNIEKYDAVLIDEVHERNINIDLMLVLIRKYFERVAIWRATGKFPAGLKRKTPVKFVLLSATMDESKFVRYFQQAHAKVEKMFIPGRAFPIEHIYMPVSGDKYEPDAEKLIIDLLQAPKYERGDILMFLPTKKLIFDFIEVFKKKSIDGLLIGGLFSGVDAATQRLLTDAKLYREHGYNRRLIFATDVAETGITVDGIIYVIEPGVGNVMRLDQESGIRDLRVTYVNKSSVIQRCGRVGRTRTGTCFHLYSEEEYNEKFGGGDKPEIFRIDLYSVIMKIIGLVNSIALARRILTEWMIDAVNPDVFDRYLVGLYRLGFIAGDEMSGYGAMMLELGVDFDMAALIIESFRWKVQSYMIPIVALMSMSRNPRDLFIDPKAAVKDYVNEYGDPIVYLRIFLNLYTTIGRQFPEEILRKYCSERGLKYDMIRYTFPIINELQKKIARFKSEMQKEPEMRFGITIRFPKEIDETSTQVRIMKCFRRVYDNNRAVYDIGAGKYVIPIEETQIDPKRGLSTFLQGTPPMIGFGELVYINEIPVLGLVFTY